MSGVGPCVDGSGLARRILICGVGRSGHVFGLFARLPFHSIKSGSLDFDKPHLQRSTNRNPGVARATPRPFAVDSSRFSEC